MFLALFDGKKHGKNRRYGAPPPNGSTPGALGGRKTADRLFGGDFTPGRLVAGVKFLNKLIDDFGVVNN